MSDISQIYNMAYSESIATFVKDQLSGIGQLRTKKMFGALAFYCDDILFGAVMDEYFTLKAKGLLQEEFESMGMTRHQIKGRDIKMPYFDVTSDILENREELLKWTSISLNALKK